MGRRRFRRPAKCGVHRALREDERLEQAVARQAVGTMDTRVRDLAACIETGDARCAVEVGPDPTDHVMRSRRHGNRMARDVEAVPGTRGSDGGKAHRGASAER